MEATDQIDRLIDSRAAGRDKANALEAMYTESVRRHHEKRRRQHRDLWLDFHLGQAKRLRKTMEILIARHEAAAAQLLEES